MIEELPKDADNRSRILSSKLAGLNDVFLKLNMRTSNQLYTSYIAYAEQIARASGGILRMLAVSKDCLLYTSDAADERSSVDLGGRRLIKKKTLLDTSAGSRITTSR